MFSRQRSLSLIFLILFLVHLGQAQARFLFAPPPGFSLTGKNDWGSMCNGGRNPYPNFEPDLATTSYFKEALIALGVVSGSFIAAGAVEYIGALLIRWGLGALLTFWGIDKILDYLPLDIEVYVYLGFLSHGAGDECSFTMSGISSYLRTPHVYFDPATAAGVKTTYIEGEFYLNYQGAINGQSIGKYQVCWVDGNNVSGCGSVRQFPILNARDSWVRLDYVEQVEVPQYYKEVWLVMEAMGGPYLIDDIGLRGYGKKDPTPTPSPTIRPSATSCPAPVATTCSASGSQTQVIAVGSWKMPPSHTVPVNFIWKGGPGGAGSAISVVFGSSNSCSAIAYISDAAGNQIRNPVLGQTISFVNIGCTFGPRGGTAIQINYNYRGQVCTTPASSCQPTPTNTLVVPPTGTPTRTPTVTSVPVTVPPKPSDTVAPTGTPTPTGTATFVFRGLCECKQQDVNHPLYPILCRQEILLCLIRDYSATIAAKEWEVNVTPPPFPTFEIKIIITPGSYPTIEWPTPITPSPTDTATPCLSCRVLEAFATEMATQTYLQQTMVALLARPSDTPTVTPTGSPTLQVSLPPFLPDGCYSPQSTMTKAIDDDLMTKASGTIRVFFTPPPGEALVGLQLWGQGSVGDISVDGETWAGFGLKGQESLFFKEPHDVTSLEFAASGLAEVAVCFAKPIKEPSRLLELPEDCYSPLSATGGYDPHLTIDESLDTFGGETITYELQQFYPERVLVGLVAWGEPGASLDNINIAYNNFPDESLNLSVMFNGSFQVPYVREDLTFPGTVLGTFLTGERLGVDQVTLSAAGNLMEIAFCFADPRPTPTPIIDVYDREPNCFTPKSAEAFGLNFVNGPSAIDENLGTYSVGDLNISFDIPLNKRITTLSVWGTPLGGGLINAISELEITGPRGSQTLVRNQAFNASIHNLQPYVREDLVINDIFTDATDIMIKVGGTNQINEVNICYEDVDVPIVTPVLTSTLYITPVLRINEIDNCVAPMSHAADQWPLFDGDLNTDLQGDFTLMDNGDYAVTGLMLWSTGNSEINLTLSTGVITTFNIVSPDIMATGRMTPTLKRLTIPAQRIKQMALSNNGHVQEFRVCYDFLAASLANAGLSGSGGSSLRCDPRCSSPERVWSSTGQDYNMLIDDDPNTCWVGGQNQKATVVNGVLQYFGVGGNLANWVVSGVAPEQFIIQAPRGINYQASSLQFISVGDNNNRVTEISYAAPYINVPPELIPLWTNLDGNNILAGIFGGNWFTSQNMNAALPGQLVKDEASFASVFQAEYFKIKMARDGQPPVMCEVCVCGNDTAAPTPVPPGPGTDWLRYVELMCMLQVLICDVGPGGVFTPTHVMTQTIVISGSPQSEMVNTQMLSTMMEIRDFLSNTGQITPSQMISINLTPIITIAWPTATPTLTATMTPTPTPTPTPVLTPTLVAMPYNPVSGCLYDISLACTGVGVAGGELFCVDTSAYDFDFQVSAPILSPPYIKAHLNYCYVEGLIILDDDYTWFLQLVGAVFAFGVIVQVAKRRNR